MISFPGGSCQDRHAPECVRWYVVSSLSERQLEALTQAWGSGSSTRPSLTGYSRMVPHWKMPSTAAAIRNDHEVHGIPITSRRGNYRDHVVEQDHRAVKRAPIPCGASRRLRPPNVPWRVSSGPASMGWSSTSPTPGGMGHPDGLRREKTAMAKNGRGAWSSPVPSMMGSRSCARSLPVSSLLECWALCPGPHYAVRRQGQGERAA
jgi:hypothetical protein